MMTWQDTLAPIKQSAFFQTLLETLARRQKTHIIYPAAKDWFRALKLTPLEAVKIVILGQDPYHQPNQANGLAFSVHKGVKIPPSLRNIYKELADDLNIKTPNHGDLTVLAKRGVLLLNTTLTVEDSTPMAHKDIGWTTFTDAVIKAVSNKKTPVVFMLWGTHAKTKIPQIAAHHLILTAPHPSPLSAHRGFFGCKHFSRANAFLKAHHLDPVDFRL